MPSTARPKDWGTEARNVPERERLSEVAFQCQPASDFPDTPFGRPSEDRLLQDLRYDKRKLLCLLCEVDEQFPEAHGSSQYPPLQG